MEWVWGNLNQGLVPRDFSGPNGPDFRRVSESAGGIGSADHWFIFKRVGSHRLKAHRHSRQQSDGETTAGMLLLPPFSRAEAASPLQWEPEARSKATLPARFLQRPPSFSLIIPSHRPSTCPKQAGAPSAEGAGRPPHRAHLASPPKSGRSTLTCTRASQDHTHTAGWLVTGRNAYPMPPTRVDRSMATVGTRPLPAPARGKE